MPRRANVLTGLRAALLDAAGIQGPTCVLGNGCGHIAGQPRPYTPPAHHEPRPQFLQFFLQRFARFYSRPESPAFITLVRARHRIRIMSAERREACVALMGAIAHYTDLATLRVGRPLDNRHKEVHGIDLVELARLAGLGLRRAERAMSDLHAAGMVGTYPIAQRRDDGSYRGRAAIRVVFKGLFEALGLGRKLNKVRKRASDDRRERKNRPPEPGSVERGQQKLMWEAAKRAAGLADPEPDDDPDSRGPPH